MSQVPITHDEQDELLQRYEKERDKRLNKAGLSQYIDVRSKEIQDLARDPWVDYTDPRIQKPPLKDGRSIKFLISGAGHNGILFGCRLVEAGFSGSDVVCVDIAGGFGGTWYWNRYSGLMCDIESYCYLPLLEETGYIPKHKYSFGAEIRGQNERAAKHFGIQGQFCTKIESQIWDHDKKVWVVTMTRTLGENKKPETITVFADFIIVAGGVLNIPKVPNLPGWQELRNNKHVFHSARWDYDYTGGNQEQPDLVKLKDKTVAIIGTGATEVQIVPELARWAKHVYVIQRTPSYCGYRGNRLTDMEHFKALSKEKGWQNSRRLNFNAWITDNPEGYGPNLVNDGQGYCREVEAMYGSWCKRPTFHDDYLGAFNQPNVTLIDTDGKGLEAFSENGFVFGDQEYEIDALILATGFVVRADLDPSGRLSAIIKGGNGETMSHKFQTAENPPVFGIAMTNFPNAFGHFGRGTPGSWNYTSVYDVEAKHTAQILRKAHMLAKDGQRVLIQVNPASEEMWGNETAKYATWYSTLQTCTPGYFTLEGEIRTTEEESVEQMLRKARLANWGAGPVDFQEKLEAFAAKPGIEGFNVTVLA
ncbi:cyclohexanone 1-2-monooxygenase [Pyrenophora teres f. maculata]|nr:cyclohexanone 1-2-monooxygenase [Pyrenophora teres f. maculata]